MQSVATLVHGAPGAHFGRYPEPVGRYPVPSRPGARSVVIPIPSAATPVHAVPGRGRSLSRSRRPLSIPIGIVATWDSEHVTAGSRVVTAIRCCCCLPLSLLIGSVQHSSIGSRDVAVVVFVVAGSDGSGSLSREAACLVVLNLRSVLPSTIVKAQTNPEMLVLSHSRASTN